MTERQIITQKNGQRVVCETSINREQWKNIVNSNAVESLKRAEAIIEKRKKLDIKNKPAVTLGRRKPGRRPGQKYVRPPAKNYLSPASKRLKTTVKRPCMCCTSVFDSEGAHNRLCSPCRHKNDD